MYAASAAVYDLLYAAMGQDCVAESAELVEQVRRRNPGARTLLDVACGTGRHLELLRADFDVLGVDLSPQMLDVARLRLPFVELVVDDMRTFDLGRTVDVAVCLFGSVAYSASTDELDATVARIAAHLAPGGVAVVDGWVRNGDWHDPGTLCSLSATGDGLAVARVDRTHRSGTRSVVDMAYLVASDDGIEHLVERHELTLFTDLEYRAAFERAGLSVEVVPSSWPDRDRYIGTSP